MRRILPDLGHRTAVMGVLNVTPDSFSDGGAFLSADAAIDHALRMMDEGADLIDVGGESTRPGSRSVPVEEEISRVLPVIRRMREHGIGPVSIDTTKAEVARRAVEAGAQLVNDISAMTFDEKMSKTVAELGVPVVLSHTRDRPEVMQSGTIQYPGGVVAAVRDSLAKSMEIAIEAGVKEEAILLDPGIGFGKTVPQNLTILRELQQIKSIGCPVLIGTSRKSFIGQITGKDERNRVFGTAASVALAIANGADVVRVHDVGEMVDVVAVTDAIVRAPKACVP